MTTRIVFVPWTPYCDWSIVGQYPYGLGHCDAKIISQMGETPGYVWDGPDGVDLSSVHNASCVADAEEALAALGFVPALCVYKPLPLEEPKECDDQPFKVVVIDGVEYTPGYPLCSGCDELTIARGWECFYDRETTECKYPDSLVRKFKELQDE